MPADEEEKARPKLEEKGVSPRYAFFFLLLCLDCLRLLLLLEKKPERGMRIIRIIGITLKLKREKERERHLIDIRLKPKLIIPRHTHTHPKLSLCVCVHMSIMSYNWIKDLFIVFLLCIIKIHFYTLRPWKVTTKGYTKFVQMSVTGIRSRGRPHKVQIFLLRITS